MKNKRYITGKELGEVIERVIAEINTQDKFNIGKEPEFIEESRIMQGVKDKIGTDWEVRG